MAPPARIPESQGTASKPPPMRKAAERSRDRPEQVSLSDWQPEEDGVHAVTRRSRRPVGGTGCLPGRRPAAWPSGGGCPRRARPARCPQTRSGARPGECGPVAACPKSLQRTRAQADDQKEIRTGPIAAQAAAQSPEEPGRGFAKLLDPFSPQDCRGRLENAGRAANQS